jgi:hypothetical protein
MLHASCTCQTTCKRCFVTKYLQILRRRAGERVKGNFLRREGVVQCRLVDDAAAGGVDHEGVGGQGRELGRPDQGAERHVHGHHSKKLKRSPPATAGGLRFRRPPA